MLRSANQLGRYRLRAVDGEIGKAEELYFDDHNWRVRYLVANTGTWLLGRRVLLAPAVLGSFEDDEKYIEVGLTREQIENSPPVYADQPLSREAELELQQYFGWPAYWGAESSYAAPVELWSLPRPTVSGAAAAALPIPAGDAHLRSSHDVVGFRIQASDGDIGHLDDLIVDDEDWVVRYILVDPRNWWPGKKVIVAREWIERVNWSDLAVHVDLTRESVASSPEFDPSKPVNREYESKLYEHYGRTRYWR